MGQGWDVVEKYIGAEGASFIKWIPYRWFFLDGDKEKELKNGYMTLFDKFFMSFSKMEYRKKIVSKFMSCNIC